MNVYRVEHITNTSLDTLYHQFTTDNFLKELQEMGIDIVLSITAIE